MSSYDALLLVSFGGPEQPADVVPFLENVLRGRNVPRARLEAVAEHYDHFGGRSPINDQNKALIAALQAAGVKLPIYWGNRNWHPFIEDTVRQMAADGVKRAIALATSAFGCYSGCRRYFEDIVRARRAAGCQAPAIDKIAPFWNRPGFIAAQRDRLREAREKLGQPDATIFFTAHSIPQTMADVSPYVEQLSAAAGMIAPDSQLVYQSRSGPPSQPWLAPDICAALRKFHAAGGRAAIVQPLGFLSDHMEVLFDLDVEARAVCDQLGISMVRAQTVGTHQLFVDDLAKLVMEIPVACRPDCCVVTATAVSTARTTPPSGAARP